MIAGALSADGRGHEPERRGEAVARRRRRDADDGGRCQAERPGFEALALDGTTGRTASTLRLVDNRRHAAPLACCPVPPVEPGEIRRFRGGSQGNPYPVRQSGNGFHRPGLARDRPEAQHLPMAHDNYIAGKWVPARSGRTDAVLDPATGELIAEVPSSDAADVDAAVTAAAAAFAEWSATTPAGARRGAVEVRRPHRGARRRAGRSSRSRNVGKPIAAMRRRDRGSPSTTCGSSPARRRCLDGQRHRRVPGRVHLDAPARPARCRRVDRAVELPAHDGRVEDRPRARGRQHRRAQAVRAHAAHLAQARGAGRRHLPARRVQRDQRSRRDGGRAARRRPDASRIVSLTGDVTTGKIIARAAADSLKRVHLELGGKAPVIVFDDADLEAVVAGVEGRGYVNAGQDCTAAVPRARRPRHPRRPRRGPLRRGAEPRDGRPVRRGHRARPGRVGRAARTGRGLRRPRPAGRRRGRRPAGTAAPGRASSTSRRSSPASRQDAEIVQREVFGPVVTVQRFADEDTGARVGERRRLRPVGVSVWTQRRRPGDAHVATRCSSARCGSTTTSRSCRRCPTAASSSRATARTCRCTRSRPTPRSST